MQSILSSNNPVKKAVGLVSNQLQEILEITQCVISREENLKSNFCFLHFNNKGRKNPFSINSFATCK